VDFQAEAVSGAVAVNGQIAFVDYLPGGGIHAFHFYPGPYRFYRGGLGLLHDIVNLLIKSGRPADCETSGNIAAIAFIFSPEVNQDGVFLFELSLARLMMRPRGIRAEGNNCREAVRRSEFANLKIKHPGQLAFDYARLDMGQCLFEGAGGYCGGGLDGFNFGIVFDTADGFNNIRN